MTKVMIGKTLAIDVDFEALFPGTVWSPVNRHVAYIGARNILMDSHASVKEENFIVAGQSIGECKQAWRDVSLKKAMEKYEQLLTGEVRVGVRGPTAIDPVTAEARKIAVETLKGNYTKDQVEEFKAMVELYMEDEDVLATAREAVEKRNALKAKLVAKGIVIKK